MAETPKSPRPGGAGRPRRTGGGDRSGGPRRSDAAPSRGRDARPQGARGQHGATAHGTRREGRREEPAVRPRRPALDAPEIPAEITPKELDPALRRQLRTLPVGLADLVARHLVAAERLLDDDPELAHRHAEVAARLASRIAAVREVFGITAYRTGRWAQALSELRAARRMSGSPDFLPMMADCERGLGRPERALTLAGSPEAQRLDRSGRVEMRIVASGARRDLGQLDAAVLALQGPELRDTRQPWSARLLYAYADALLTAGRSAEAHEWFGKAADADLEGETDAAERLAELDGVVYVDLEAEGGADDEAADDAGQRPGSGPSAPGA